MPTYNEITLAKELIKFPSITPIDAGIMKFLAKKLTAIGFKCKILEFKDKNSKPVKNLYARLGKSQPNFMFAGHLDVVPPGDLKDWTVNPFNPTIKKNHLIGRGANDMKSAIASWVVAVNNFVSNNKKIKGSISLLITGDEEGIAINGTKKVVDYLKKKKEKINFCLVGEPTNPNKLGEMIKIGRRGSITGELTIIGSQGHVAYPDRANNPSNTMVEILKKWVPLTYEAFEDYRSDSFQLSKEALKIVKDNGGKAILTKGDHQSGSDRIYEAYSKEYKKKADLIINLQGDMPNIKPSTISKLASQMRSNKCDIGTLASQLKDQKEFKNPNVVKVHTEKELNVNTFLQVKDFFRERKYLKNEKIYHHIGIYAFTNIALTKYVKLARSKLEIKRNLEQMRALDNHIPIRAFITASDNWAIDTDEDLQKVKQLIENSVKEDNESIV